MEESIRDKVTDLIFKAKLTPQVRPQQPPPAQAQQQAPGAGDGVSAGFADGGGQRSPAAAAPLGAAPPRPVPVAQPATAAAAAAAAAQGTEAQRRDLEAAEQAGGGEAAPKRKPVRARPTVGRNEPCPCGSGKKFKQCCGKRT
jgi:hypothetical protein